MTITIELVDEQTLFILEVLVALAAVVMAGGDDLVLDHLLDGVEGEVAAQEGAGDFARRNLSGHDGWSR